MVYQSEIPIVKIDLLTNHKFVLYFRWWKIHEASMLALGSVQDVVERQIKAGNVNFDMNGFLHNVVLADVANPGNMKGWKVVFFLLRIKLEVFLILKYIVF